MATAAQCTAQHSFPHKLSGWDFYRSIGSPKYIVAPMVDQSELAWRILSRRYNADLCYTPMFNAKLFANQQRYRDEHWAGLKDGLGGGSSNDRPLIAQFCANDPEILLQAALMVAPYCDAVDINLGCPQHIARRGHYGSFLMEDWPLISSLISTLHNHLPIPVTAKIRVFPEADKTVEYAKMVVESGAQMLVVHGRLREMKGHLTGIADWEKIRLVQEAVGHLVPVIANGNILYHSDLARCIDETGCAGIMSAEGNLYNPAIFTPHHPESWKLAEEYLTICDELDTKIAYTRGHLFKIFRPSFTIHTDLRAELGLASSREEIWIVARKMKERLIQDAEASRMKGDNFDGQVDSQGFPIFPHWLAQPCLRQPMPEPQHTSKDEEGNHGDTVPLAIKRNTEDSTSGHSNSTMSLAAVIANSERAKKAKKTRIAPNICHGASCNNTSSATCVHQRCKGCCRGHQYETSVFDCVTHQIRSHLSKDGMSNLDTQENMSPPGGMAS
ncbi:tRNA-dihydrouridine(16/17) synthase [NAD(P)(+)]-like protein [Dissophora globulifera]|uniref:tRNA-dihydrouridine(16/17) synthase [NAD(P)(+)] n=1 Tax=Dissophora globulifera TaxID=979702 RepID=A0A9P6RWB9_9FUNG|nr:tRNA-dihydrouridine(16/17) synthase [NAD(P)(+)]-like protein [Dissophora globulifera]KAG0330310.1 tRNA-dihydrouridine(16/17) synthase [NAD(P)(+)]-like protein [Dissophora globulifera]